MSSQEWLALIATNLRQHSAHHLAEEQREPRQRVLYQLNNLSLDRKQGQGLRAGFEAINVLKKTRHL